LRVAFPEPDVCDIIEFMSGGTWFRMLFSILAIAGLILGPITAPVNGAGLAAAAPASEMKDDMQCCQPEQPSVPDCPMACLSMAVCMAKCSSSVPPLLDLKFLLSMSTEVIARGGDLFHDSLAVEPPARPPRT
jgi:hypothetical protein